MSICWHRLPHPRLAVRPRPQTRFNYALPLAVDTMGDEAEKIYAAWPERLYIIDAKGVVAYKGEPGRTVITPKKLRRGWPGTSSELCRVDRASPPRRRLLLSGIPCDNRHIGSFASEMLVCALLTGGVGWQMRDTLRCSSNSVDSAASAYPL
jgi:hypothetical protein